MSFGERFSETSVKGALIRASIAWVLITPAVAAAKIWWSGAAAVVVCILGVAVYVVAAGRVRLHYREPPAAR